MDGIGFRKVIPPAVDLLPKGVVQEPSGEVNLGVGDINSKERGTAARYNGDKAKLEYVPMRTLCDAFFMTILDGDLLAVVGELVAEFEAGDDEAIYNAVHRVFKERGVEETCSVFHFGAQKYAAWNWAKGFSWSVPLACFKRHWTAFVRGEETDPESGLSHWGHIGCNLVMLTHFTRFYREGDDRPPRELFSGVSK